MGQMRRHDPAAATEGQKKTGARRPARAENQRIQL